MAEDAVQEAVMRRGSAPTGATGSSTSLRDRDGRAESLTERDAAGARRAASRARLGAAPASEEPHDRVDVRRALAALPRRQREAAVLRYSST